MLYEGVWKPTSVVRRYQRSVVMDAQKSESSIHSLLVSAGRGRCDELRIAKEMGAKLLLCLSLDADACLLLFLESDPRPKRLISDDILELIGRQFSTALRTCHLIERVAAVTRETQNRNRELKHELSLLGEQEDFIARSPAMRELIQRVRLVAPHPTAVLITGESGTGKEVVANLIHRSSPRHQQPLITVNCGALPESLVESELFGHEKGAFTGAEREHHGRFERARHGSIFLDEIGELPLAAQVKILRVLQEGEFERVGGEEIHETDVRVIAATHQPLESLAADGRFREDLFYRLNVFPIHIPPLRERPEDIPALTHHLLKAVGSKLGREIPDVPERVISQLIRYEWPGNVRELANVLEAAAILTTGRNLKLPELRSGVRAFRQDAARSEVMTFEDASRHCIQSALEQSDGRIYGENGAAVLLGLQPSTMQSKMRKLGIERLG